MRRKPNYPAILERTLRDLEHDIAQKPRDEKSVRLLWYAVRWLARLTPLDPPTAGKLEILSSRLGKPYGISDAIRSVLFIVGRRVAPVEIRKLLEATGFDLRRYTYAMAAIHNTLKRLVDRGEVRAEALTGGGRLYKWLEADGHAGARKRASRRLAATRLLVRGRARS